jgi:hypothetical protein
LNEPGQSENDDVLSISQEEELTPRPKRNASRTQVFTDGISELASTDNPDWEMSPGDNEEDEADSTDVATMEEDDTLGADNHDSDPEESPRQQKNKAKSSKQKNARGVKGKGNLRAAILQGRQRTQPAVSPTRGDDDCRLMT